MFLQSPQGFDSSLAATALFEKLDRKQSNQWSKLKQFEASTFHNLVVKHGVY